MAKAIEQLKSGLTIGNFGLGMHGNDVGSVKHQVHDGDTVFVRAFGNFGIRFLGIDTPEISFTLPGNGNFISISDQRWADFLTDPFAAQYPPLNLNAGLRNFLLDRLGEGTAANHYDHALAAQRALEQEILNDLNELSQEKEDFQFFVAFASEIMDRYGRLLAYINRSQKEEPRPLDYNSRVLKAGMANPYFIWPNINPFRKQRSIRDSVPEPNSANTIANQESTLRQARGWVQDARTRGVGLFDINDPLRLQPFELRFLAQRRAPNRWVIDLSKNDDVLINPQEYYKVPNTEDRLFIPDEDLPLFVEKGWRKQ